MTAEGTHLDAQLSDWLHGDALLAVDLSTLCQHMITALNQLGVPAARLNLGVFLMHPELAGVALRVGPEDDEALAVEVTHEALQQPIYLDSPVRAAVEGGESLRFQLRGADRLPFPVLDELRGEGFTDYFIAPLKGTQGRTHVLSLATRAADGFTEAHVAALQRFCRPFALLVDSLTVFTLAEVLLRLYVGSMTAPRVLRGQVRLGRGESIQAAILYSDLRDFSRYCSRHGTGQTIDLLNQYLSVVSGCVQANAGEVIKLMGDALLAVFPLDESAEDPRSDAARRCLKAATESQRRLMVSEGRSEPLVAGFGLTLGEVIYGNIGAPGRLDFTIIGDAVNLAARLEALSKTEAADILLGPQLAQACARPLRALGGRSLKGFDQLVDVFALEP